MVPSFKLIGVAAALLAGVVTAYEVPQARDSAAPVKAYYDRVLPSDEASARGVAPSGAAWVDVALKSGKGDRLRETGCAAQTWPNISRECLAAENGAPIRTIVRTITIEQRDVANTSTLMRVPRAEMASR